MGFDGLIDLSPSPEALLVNCVGIMFKRADCVRSVSWDAILNFQTNDQEKSRYWR
jgi:hypothetical protein